MYSLERWTRTFFVCLCVWLSLPFSMQQPGAADSNEKAHGVVSVIAACGGFSDGRRKCLSHDAYLVRASGDFSAKTNAKFGSVRGWGSFRRLTFELSRAWRQGA